MISDDKLEFDEYCLAYLDGKPYSGWSFEEGTERRGRSEIQYLNGSVHGLARDWYPSGGRRTETLYRAGIRYGEERRWAEDGTLQEVVIWEFEVRVKRIKLGPDGSILEKWHLPPEDPRWTQIHHLRAKGDEAFGLPPPDVDRWPI